MTNKVKVSKSTNTSQRLETQVLYVVTTVSLITVMTIVTSMSENRVNAQMMMGDNGSFVNTTSTSSLHSLLEKGMTTSNGTINLQQTIFNAIHSKVNTSLIQAMTTAERTVGNNSFAVAGFGGEYGGYFAYQVILSTPRMEFYTVLVDPGNGHVLATQKITAAELEKMHQEHSAEVVQSGGHGGLGFPFLIPH
jgi:hypothetical protein